MQDTPSGGGVSVVRHVATALLIGASLLYLIALHYEARYAPFSYLRAFAEAAMVGALADWFAVSALFRRPLGLPIPHTAVLPRNKARIGVALGTFVERNFLDHKVVRAHLAGVDFAAQLADWLSERRQRAQLVDQLAAWLPAALEQIDDACVRRSLGNTVHAEFERLELGPLGVRLLTTLVDEQHHQPLVDEMLRQAAVLLKQYEPQILDKVRTRTAWLWRKLAVSEQVAGQLLEATEEALGELVADRSHPWRQRADAALRDYLKALADSPDYRIQVAALKEQLWQHPEVQGWLDRAWPGLKASLGAELARPSSLLRGQLRKGLAQLAEALHHDEALRARLNGWAAEQVLALVEARRPEVARLIASTVQGWDAATMTARIEQQIGDDLQYIRINGTLIGGLAGLLIHGVTQLVG